MILSKKKYQKSCLQRLPSILLSNARSILPKLDELRLLNSVYHTSILAITESWLTDSIDSSLLGFANYIFYRCDRNSGRGGGVCMWCNSDLLPEAIPTQKHHKTELLALHLRRIDCVFILVYIPPGISAMDSRSINDNIINIIDSHLSYLPDSEITVCGDFNRHDARDIESSLYLTNVVKQPTRNLNILDKIFLSKDIRNNFEDPVILPPLSSSDHNCILLKPSLATTKEPIVYHTVLDLRIPMIMLTVG